MGAIPIPETIPALFYTHPLEFFINVGFWHLVNVSIMDSMCRGWFTLVRTKVATSGPEPYVECFAL